MSDFFLYRLIEDDGEDDYKVMNYEKMPDASQESNPGPVLCKFMTKWHCIIFLFCLYGESRLYMFTVTLII